MKVIAENFEIPCQSETEAVATMWALAKSVQPVAAKLWRGDRWETNAHLRALPVPEHLYTHMMSILHDFDQCIVNDWHVRADDPNFPPMTFEDVLKESPDGWSVIARNMIDIAGRNHRRAIWQGFHPEYYNGEKPMIGADGVHLVAKMWAFSAELTEVEADWAEES